MQFTTKCPWNLQNRGENEAEALPEGGHVAELATAPVLVHRDDDLARRGVGILPLAGIETLVGVVGRVVRPLLSVNPT